MKNLFSGLRSFVEKQETTLSQKIQTLKSSVRNKVLALTGGIIIWASSPAMAADWKKVETAGIGPREFAMQNFQTENWRQLTDRNGNTVRNPSTDLILGREYTLQSKKTGTTGEEKWVFVSKKTNQESLSPQDILNGKTPEDDEVIPKKVEIKKTLSPKIPQKSSEIKWETKRVQPPIVQQKKTEPGKQEWILKKLFGVSFWELMGLDFPTYKLCHWWY